MARKPRRLSRTTVIVRVDNMIKLILREVRVGIEVEAALEVANEVVKRDLREAKVYGASCYNSVRQSMALFLALTLAKLFEIPTPRSGETRATRYNRSDVASIPLMIRLLKQRRCRTALSKRARGWTPALTGTEDIHATFCERAIDRAIEAYDQIRRTRGRRSAIAKLKAFRDKALAHTLLGDALEKTPSYNELFLLMDVARDVTDQAKLAILGNGLDLKKVERERVRMAEAFWRPALTAAADAS
jgi:hypothetical protein